MPRVRFSLRTVLGVITLLAVVAAGYARYAPQRRLARDWLQRGGRVTYHRPLLGLPDRLAWYLCDIQSVDLSRRAIRAEDLEAMARLPRLEALYLARCEITDGVARNIGRCRSLRRLALWSTTLYDAQVAALAPLARLEVLDLHDSHVTDACLETLHRLPALRDLRFNFTLSDHGIAWLAESRMRLPAEVRLRHVTDAGLLALEQCDRTGTHIAAIESHDVTGAGLVRLFESYPPSPVNRCDLRLSGRQLTPAFLRHLPLEAFSCVGLDGTAIRVRDLVEPLQGRAIQLNVNRWVALFTRVCRPFEQVEPPAWYGIRIEEDWFAACLPRLQSVTHLALDKAPDLPTRGVLRRLGSLKHIKTDGTLPAGFIDELSFLPQLESLDIGWNDGVEPQPLEPLAHLSNLRRVRFTATPFSAEQIRPLGELRSLEELELHACHFDRATIEAFPNFRQLRVHWSSANGPRAHRIEELRRHK